MKPETKKEGDVCLVGLGATGAMAAYVLTQAGRRVVALEAGPARSGPEHVMDELWSAAARNAWGAAKFNQELPTWRPNARSPRQPTPHTWRLANGVGGSSLPYAAMSWRFHPDDFQVRSNTIARYGPDALPAGSCIADWPVTYDELEPYYDLAERLLGVSGQAGNLRGRLTPDGNPFEGPRQNPYPLPPLRTSGIGELFREAALEAGYHPFPVPAAILSEPYEGRQACTYCSFCNALGCHVKAKGSVLWTVLPWALASGNLEVRSGCRALRLVVDDGGEAVGVEYQGPDGAVFQAAGTVVLASYTFENVRLLLLSRGRHFPQGVGNNSGQVGRCFMARNSSSLFGVFEGRRLNRFIGPMAQSQTIDDLNADNFDHAGLGFIRGGRIAAINQAQPVASSCEIPPGVRRWGRPYKAFLAHYYNKTATLRLNAETLPYDGNFLDLDSEVRDPLGMPVVRITFDLQGNERRLMAYLQERAVELMKAMGASRVWCTPFAAEAITTHDVGGARMGTDSERSVVDAFGRVHEAPRVFILGSATYPTLSGLNPTLTMQALALRTAAQIAGVDVWKCGGMEVKSGAR